MHVSSSRLLDLLVQMRDTIQRGVTDATMPKYEFVATRFGASSAAHVDFARYTVSNANKTIGRGVIWSFVLERTKSAQSERLIATRNHNESSRRNLLRDYSARACNVKYDGATGGILKHLNLHYAHIFPRNKINVIQVWASPRLSPLRRSIRHICSNDSLEARSSGLSHRSLSLSLSLSLHATSRNQWRIKMSHCWSRWAAYRAPRIKVRAYSRDLPSVSRGVTEPTVSRRLLTPISVYYGIHACRRVRASSGLKI